MEDSRAFRPIRYASQLPVPPDFRFLKRSTGTKSVPKRNLPRRNPRRNNSGIFNLAILGSPGMRKPIFVRPFTARRSYVTSFAHQFLFSPRTIHFLEHAERGNESRPPAHRRIPLIHLGRLSPAARIASGGGSPTMFSTTEACG